MKNIILNTNNVVPGSNNSKFEYFFPSTVEFRDDQIAVANISLGFSWDNIKASYNNNFFQYVWYDNLGASTHNVLIPDGIYNIQAFNAFLQYTMINNGHYLIDGNGDYVYFLDVIGNTVYFGIELRCGVIPTALPAGFTAPVGFTFPAVATTPQFIIPPTNIQKLLGFSDSGSISTSIDSGITWKTGSDKKSWRAITSSSDGVKLAATVTDGYIFTSSDSGTTWTQQTLSGARLWSSITSSTDGVKLAATVTNGYIFTSSNSGTSWTQQTLSGAHNWTSIASSSDGVKLAATDAGGVIYTSIDSGVTWTAQASGSRNWTSIASSSDGVKLAATHAGGVIYTSTDSGATWTAQASGSHNWTSIASSSDGVKLAATDNGGVIYTSTDSGATWTAQASGSGIWTAIASSSDGVKLAATVSGGYIYTSSDSGVTWTQRTNSGQGNWSSIASSVDGVKLVAVKNSGIYPPAPQSTPYSILGSPDAKFVPVSTINVLCNLVNNRLQYPNNIVDSFTPQTSGKTGGSSLNIAPYQFIFTDVSDGYYSHMTIEFVDQDFQPLVIQDPEVFIQLLFKKRGEVIFRK